MDFTPYESGGSWADSDAGWSFQADYAWGWLPFHYGRWAWFHDYWGWVPGHRWGAAWVDWRHGNGVVGWRPRPPGHGYHHNGYQYGGGAVVRDHRHPLNHDSNWRFATTRDFTRPHIRSHLYGNGADGLRLTARVNAPPLRARTTVHAGELMRGRYAPADRQVVRDHRDFGRDQGRDLGRGGGYRPSGGDAPAARGYPPPAAPRGYSSSTGRPSEPGGASMPSGSSGSSAPSGGYYAPGRTYPPGRGYAPGNPTRPSFGGSGSSVVRDHRSAPPVWSQQAGNRPPPAAPPPPAAAPSHAGGSPGPVSAPPSSGHAGGGHAGGSHTGHH